MKLLFLLKMQLTGVFTWLVSMYKGNILLCHKPGIFDGSTTQDFPDEVASLFLLVLVDMLLSGQVTKQGHMTRVKICRQVKNSSAVEKM